MLNSSFKTIGLIVRQQIPQHLQEIETICKELSAHARLLVHFLDAESHLQDCPQTSIEQIGTQADLAISIGGDGTLLTAARNMVDYDVPLVGINLGRLGFLADVTQESLKQCVKGLFNGQFSVEKRFLLEGEIQQRDAEPETHRALNDIILHSHESISMIEFEVYSDGQLINRQRADGLIVSTPTGSTAYSLSGGGPIMHPSLDALALVPICPHTLSHRPIIIPSDRCIEIRLTQPEQEALLSFDGQSRAILHMQDHITIKRHTREITLLHPADYDYFHILREKLKWSNQP
jgi:NAD+ kinase